MDEHGTEILTPSEAARLIRRSVETLKYWRHRGEGPRSWRSGRRVFYDRGDVMAWLAEQRQNDVRGGGGGQG